MPLFLLKKPLTTVFKTIKMATISKKIRFDKSGYYFIALIVLAFAGFWPSYFSKFFNHTNDFNFYFHFHATMMMLWVIMLIVQPLLIRKKQLHLHRLIGKASYILMPLLLTSVLMVLNNSLKKVPESQLSFNEIIFPCRDFLLLTTAYSIAILYRHQVQIHARAMVITGIVFIEPALFRLFGRVIFKNFPLVGFYTGVTLILGLLVTLIILERKQKTGRWLFPAFLIIDVIVYCIVIFNIPLHFLDPMVIWFSKLSLT